MCSNENNICFPVYFSTILSWKGQASKCNFLCRSFFFQIPHLLAWNPPRTNQLTGRLLFSTVHIRKNYSVDISSLITAARWWPRAGARPLAAAGTPPYCAASFTPDTSLNATDVPATSPVNIWLHHAALLICSIPALLFSCGLSGLRGGIC